MGNQRIGATFYSRESIDSNLRSSTGLDPLVKNVLEVYASCDEKRKDITNELHDGTHFQDSMCSVHYVRNPCNLESSGFHQPFAYIGILLAQKFSLSFPEMVGVALANTLRPNTSYYFTLSCIEILQNKNLPDELRQYKLGHKLMQLVDSYKTDMKQ